MDMQNFVAPGPGPWELETAHFPKPASKLGLEQVMAGYQKGFAYGTARYGLLLSHFKPAIVNGFWYQQAIAFGAPEGAKGPPPKPILWLLTRLHPGMRARIAAGAEAMSKKLWREDLRIWDEEDKPRALAAHRALLAVDVRALDDASLAKHLHACEAHVGEMIFLHHKYTIGCALPVGDFLAHVSAWTGKSAGEVLEALRGSSRVSLGFSATELDALAKALRADPEARAILAGSDPAAVIAALRAHGGEVGAAMRELYDLVEHRALSYDVGERACGEMPDMLVKAIRAAADGRFEAARDDAKARAATLKATVPKEHHTTFDALLEEARHINRLRDERGLYADCWAVGIARRAALEAGRRLAARGQLEAFEHAVDLTAAEADALLLGRGGPSASEVAARVLHRTTKTVADCPAFLGCEPAPPPDPEILPEAARRGARAVTAMISNVLHECETPSSKDVVRGFSVNTGVYEGTARRVDGASDFGRIEQGDVLVTRSTSAYFNVVLPLLGAIVTDRGGQLSHAAIVAREYGIPGIVGTRDATKLIPDGARVRVDGTTGEITVLGV